MRRGSSSCVNAAASSRQAKTYCDYCRASKTLSDRCCWRRKLGGLSLGVHYSSRKERSNDDDEEEEEEEGHTEKPRAAFMSPL
jgi:hypothetical protein